MSDNKKRILFVDDEPRILEGLKRMLRSQRHDWDMHFVGSGKEALATMETDDFDIIISDMRMPGMDGVELLNKVKELYPGMVRFILSGHADKEMILQSIGPTHQFLSKPCDTEVLKSSITRTLGLRTLLKNERILRNIKDAGKLPTLPELYQKVSDKLRSATSDIKDIAEVISMDIPVTAKILQLVNSSFFGLPRQIGDVESAISLFGIDIITSVILTSGVFEEFNSSAINKFHIRDIYSHSVKTGTYASNIVKQQIKDKKMAEEARLAGMIHDFGKLVFVSTGSEEWEEAYSRHRKEKRPLHQVEQEMLGITHAEVGAYLLGVWGVSDNIVEAVAFHHRPDKGHTKSFGTMAAIYLANVFENNQCSKGIHLALDEDYINTIGMTEALPELEKVCHIDEDQKDGK